MVQIVLFVPILGSIFDIFNKIIDLRQKLTVLYQISGIILIKTDNFRLKSIIFMVSTIFYLSFFSSIGGNTIYQRIDMINLLKFCW